LPHLWPFWNRSGEVIANRDDALHQAAAAVRSGQILALKGLGGFQLIVDARNDVAVKRLRDRKHRPDKPLAVMFPSIDRVREYCQVNPLAAQLLQSANAPIVLLPIRDRPPFAQIAPHNPNLGVMLPYTPLHHLLLAELNFPVVATSGNRSDEPICIDEIHALTTLGGIADVFLVHNRPIARPVDDSIVQIVNGQPSLLRRARGYAPMPISLGDDATTSDETILAVGGHLKNTVALYVNRQLFVSQYIGDLDCVPTCDRFRSTIRALCSLYNVTPSIVACDLHPDYYSTQFAQTLATKDAPQPRLISVQHHYAHVLSCLVDNQWRSPVLGIAWDGTGYGLDGTIWGGEFLWLPAESGFIRAAHLRTFPLPGGEQAIKEPRRCAVGLLYECLGEAVFDSARRTLRERWDLAPVQSFLPAELSIVKTMLQRGLNTPRTSSMGRLFDAIASLLGLCQKSSFEGQAAMQLEFAIDGHITDATYPYQIAQQPDLPLQFDYVPTIEAILEDLHDRVSPAIISATFHNTLVAGLVDIACRLRNQYPEMVKVVLTGGCFQNRYLLERSIDRLQQQDFLVGYHHQLPSNDGGISAGQVVAALRLLNHDRYQ
jgi:hydrogenase maturation protein HypF